MLPDGAAILKGSRLFRLHRQAANGPANIGNLLHEKRLCNAER